MSSSEKFDRNQRKAPRHNVSSRGLVVVEDEHLEFPCRIKNLSRDGALLEFEEVVDLPNWFEVVFENVQMKVKSRAVWKQSEQVGVRFYSKWTEYEAPSDKSWLQSCVSSVISWINS